MTDYKGKGGTTTPRLIECNSEMYVTFLGELGVIERGGGLFWLGCGTELPNPLLQMSSNLWMLSGGCSPAEILELEEV